MLKLSVGQISKIDRINSSLSICLHSIYLYKNCWIFFFHLIFPQFRLLISIDVPNSIYIFPMHFNPIRHPIKSLFTSHWLIPYECVVYMHTCFLTFSVFIQFEIHWICCRQINGMYIQLAVVTVSKTIRIQQRSTILLLQRFQTKICCLFFVFVVVVSYDT